MSQHEHSEANRNAWAHRAYEASVRLGGSPAEAAAKLKENPAHTLRHYRDQLGDLRGKKIANLLGSSGKKAVALALLNAEVTIVDMVEENRRYALECAQAAGVELDYLVFDLLEWDTEAVHGHFDLVLMELGILHYFLDLNPVANVVFDILRDGGRLILHEVHPFIRKLAPKQDGGTVIIEGNYFSEDISTGPPPRHLAFSKDEAGAVPEARYRYWRMGEIITAVAESGLVVERLVENPRDGHSKLPETFTLVAKK